MEAKTERRLTYSYGVNKNLRITGFYADFDTMHATAVERSWGPVNIDKREQREVLIITTEWEEV